jgi:heat shock protein 5
VAPSPKSSDELLTSVQKRLIGRKFNEKEVQNDIKHFPFSVVNKKGQPNVKVDVHNEETTFTPEEISAMVLGKVRALAHSL